MVGTFNYGLGSILPRVISFFLIPLYTHYLVPDDYGIVELCASIGLVTMTLMRFGVPGSVSRFYFDHKDNPEDLKDYVTTVHRFLIAGSIVVAILVGLVFYFFGEHITPGLLFYPFIVLVLINNTFSANSDLQRRLLQSAEKSRYTIYLNLFNSLIGIVAAIVFVVGFKLGAVGILLSQLITTAIFFVQAQLYLRPYTNGTFKTSMLKTSLKYGVNTLPHLLFVLLAPLISKVILLQSNSMAALGIYSLAYRFTQPLQILYTAFNQAFNPIYFSLRKENTEPVKIQKYFRIIWLVSSILLILSIFILPPLIPLITPPRFHTSADLVSILATSFIWQIIYFLTVIDFYYLKKTKYIPLITLGGLIANILITITFVHLLGAEALAWAQVGGCVVWAFMSKYLASKHGDIVPTNVMLIHTLLLSVVTLFLERVVIPNDMLVTRILVALGFCALLIYQFAFRDKEILEIIKNFRKKPLEEEITEETEEATDYDHSN